MAITGSYSTNTGVSLNLVAYYSYDQSVAANTSTVTVTLKLRHSSLYNNGLSGSYLSVAGNSVNYSKSISYSSTTVIETTLATKTVTVTHNSNGTGSCNIKAYFAFNGTYSGQRITGITLNETLTLQTIPRVSNITKIANSGGTAISAIDSGSVIRVYWTPAASTYKYRVQCTVSGAIYTYPSSSTFYTPGSTSTFATPVSGTGTITTAHSWLPNDSSGQVSVKLYTYDSGGTQIGDPQPSSFTLNVPANILPSISAFTATVVDGKGGYYVQGKSKVALAVTASKGNGAGSISSYTYTGRNITSSSSISTTTSAAITSAILSSDGSESYSVTVKDSRGRPITKSLAAPIVVYPYAPPTISSITVQRCDSNGTINSNGTYAYVTVKSAYSPINGANTRTVILSNSSDNYVTKTTIQATSNTSDTYSGVYGSSFAVGVNYTIRATITDTAYSNTASKDALLGTAERPINFAKYGNGISVGGMSSVASRSASGLFEINWDSIFYNDLYVGSTKTLANKISGLAKCATRMTSGDLNTVYAPGIYTVSSSVSNIPSNSVYTVVVFPYSSSSTAEATNRYMAQIAITSGSVTSNNLYIRHCYEAGQWTSWLRVSVDEDSGWITLNTEVKYRKKNGWVCVTGQCSGTKTLTQNNYTNVGTLPSSYRPSVQVPFTFHGYGSSVGSMSAYVSSDGSINMYTTESGKNYWMFSVTFPV